MSDNEHIGYGKPPKHTQFTKGQSGNPKGRPKGSKNFATTLCKELNARVPITENGTHKKVSKQEAIAKQLVNKSAAGDPRAMSMVLGEIRQIDDKPETSDATSVFASESAQGVFQHMLERMRRIASNTGQAPVISSNTSNEGEQQ